MKNIVFLICMLVMYVCFAETIIQRTTFTPESTINWQKTKSTQFKINDKSVVIDGTTWDSKIWLDIQLKPSSTYKIRGEGKGRIMVHVSAGWVKKIASLNLSGSDWRENHINFTTGENSKYILIIQVNAAEGRGEIRSITIEPSEESEKVILDPEKLKANRPSPSTVRGFVVGPNFTDDTAREVVKWGANVIRYQIMLNDKAGSPPEKLLPENLELLETAVKAAQRHNLKVIVDLHSCGSFKREENTGFWQQPTLESDFILVWKEIAQRLRQYRETIWGYDLCNEPLDRDQLPYPPREWRPIALKTLAAIRTIDNEVWIIFEPGPGGQHDSYRNMQPLPDYRVIYSFHYYSPQEYTHQGIINIKDTDLTKIHEKINIKYPGSINGVSWNKEKIDETLQCVRDFQNKYPVPFFVGEFSAARWAPGADNYLRDCIDVFEKNGWSWTYHALNDWSGWSLEYDNTYWIDDMGWNHPDRPRKKIEGVTGRGEVIKTAFRNNQTK